LGESKLELAARLGHGPAQQALGREPPLLGWPGRGRPQDVAYVRSWIADAKVPLIRAAVRICASAHSEWKTAFPLDTVHGQAMDAVTRWIECPCAPCSRVPARLLERPEAVALRRDLERDPRRAIPIALLDLARDLRRLQKGTLEEHHLRWLFTSLGDLVPGSLASPAYREELTGWALEGSSDATARSRGAYRGRPRRSRGPRACRRSRRDDRGPRRGAP